MAMGPTKSPELQNSELASPEITACCSERDIIYPATYQDPIEIPFYSSRLQHMGRDNAKKDCRK